MKTPHRALAVLAASAIAQPSNALEVVIKPSFAQHKQHSRNKRSNSPTQRQTRLNRRRLHAAGKKGAFA